MGMSAIGPDASPCPADMSPDRWLASPDPADSPTSEWDASPLPRDMSPSSNVVSSHEPHVSQRPVGLSACPRAMSLRRPPLALRTSASVALWRSYALARGQDDAVLNRCVAFERVAVAFLSPPTPRNGITSTSHGGTHHPVAMRGPSYARVESGGLVPSSALPASRVRRASGPPRARARRSSRPTRVRTRPR